MPWSSLHTSTRGSHSTGSWMYGEGTAATSAAVTPLQQPLYVSVPEPSNGSLACSAARAPASELCRWVAVAVRSCCGPDALSPSSLLSDPMPGQRRLWQRSLCAWLSSVLADAAQRAHAHQTARGCLSPAPSTWLASSHKLQTLNPKP